MGPGVEYETFGHIKYSLSIVYPSLVTSRLLTHKKVHTLQNKSIGI